jgi:cell division protein FtsL
MFVGQNGGAASSSRCRAPRHEGQGPAAIPDGPDWPSRWQEIAEEDDGQDSLSSASRPGRGGPPSDAPAGVEAPEPKMEAFEYAIKKDVRNNPIVREVDERRLREQWQLLAIGGLFVMVILFSGWQRVELLQHGYRVEQMQQQRADEEEINRHLKLEIETLKSPERIETLATDELHLVAPDAGAAVIIERVKPAEPPSASVVASAQEKFGERAQLR